MAKIQLDIHQLGGETIIVSFTPPAKVAAFLAKYPQPFLVVSDVDRKAYQAFGLGKTTWRAMLQPGVISRYLGLMLRGWIPAVPDESEDIWQLGGDFVLDGASRLRYARRSADPVDRPSPAELFDAVRAAAKLESRL